MTVPESIRATAIEAAEKLIPAPKASQYVGEWPKDERDLYRDTDWRSFTERGEALDRLRIHKAAVALVDAVLPAVVAQGRTVNHDPEPWCSTAPDFERYANPDDYEGRHGVTFDPRPEYAVLDNRIPAVVAQVQADTLEEAAWIVENTHGGTHESQRESFAAALRKRAAEYREKGDNHHAE